MKKYITWTILLVIITSAGYFLYDWVSKKGFNQGYEQGKNKGLDEGEKIGVTKGKKICLQQEFHQNYQDYSKYKNNINLKRASFSPNIDFEEVFYNLRKASLNKDLETKKKFKLAVKELNLEMLKHLCRRYDFTEDEGKSVFEAYILLHDEISDNYYNQFNYLNRGIGNQKNNSNSNSYTKSGKLFININHPGIGKPKKINKTPIVSQSSYTTATNFSKIISTNACLLFDMVFGIVCMTPQLKMLNVFLGVSCQVFLADMIEVIDSNLIENAIIYDYNSSKVVIEKQFRKMISELATIEDEFDSRVERKLESRVDQDTWLVGGALLSWADASFKVHSNIKAGVDLNEYFDLQIDHNLKTIVITLAHPKILSSETDYIVEKIDDGWLVEIDEQIINSAMLEGKNQNIQQAYNSGIIQHARVSTSEIIKTFFEPMLSHPGGSYSLNVEYPILKTYK